MRLKDESRMQTRLTESNLRHHEGQVRIRQLLLLPSCEEASTNQVPNHSGWGWTKVQCEHQSHADDRPSSPESWKPENNGQVSTYATNFAKACDVRTGAAHFALSSTCNEASTWACYASRE
jgi:hypothetical protein